MESCLIDEKTLKIQLESYVYVYVQLESAQIHMQRSVIEL